MMMMLRSHCCCFCCCLCCCLCCCCVNPGKTSSSLTRSTSYKSRRKIRAPTRTQTSSHTYLHTQQRSAAGVDAYAAADVDVNNCRCCRYCKKFTVSDFSIQLSLHHVHVRMRPPAQRGTDFPISRFSDFAVDFPTVGTRAIVGYTQRTRRPFAVGKTNK